MSLVKQRTSASIFYQYRSLCAPRQHSRNRVILPNVLENSNCHHGIRSRDCEWYFSAISDYYHGMRSRDCEWYFSAISSYKTGVKHSMVSKQLKDDHGITVMESYTGPQHVYACPSAHDSSNEISIISGRTMILYHGTVVCKSHVASA